MKTYVLLVAVLFCCCGARAQRTIKMNRLWAKPQVHVFFEGYTLSFKIKDIDRALLLLAETGDTTFGLPSGLDTAAEYHCELFQVKMEYRNKLQPLMQQGVGTFLLLAGHAEIRGRHRRKVKAVIADIKTSQLDDELAYVTFYDPRNNRILFSGSMAVNLYNKDLGIE